MSAYTLITGCDSGIGQALRDQFLLAGEPLICTYLDLSHTTAHPLEHSIQLDLSKSESVNNCIAKLIQLAHSHGIAGMICNAGISYLGPVEDLDMNEFRRVFEVNVFAALQIIQKLIPGIRGVKGRIMLVGSRAGKIPLPYFSAYSASKSAIETLADSLRRELGPVGVHVILARPGAVKTPIWQRGIDQDISFVGAVYKNRMVSLRDAVASRVHYSPPDAAKRMYRMYKKKHPPSHFYVSNFPLKDKLMSLLPSKLVDRVLVKLQKGSP
jgi:short-subunit dehydrogenase